MDHPCQFTIQFTISLNILTPDSVACTLHHRDNLGLLTLSYLDEWRSGQRSSRFIGAPIVPSVPPPLCLIGCESDPVFTLGPSERC